MNVSSTGNGAHNIRSINVRANLLSEWTTDQVRFRSEAVRYIAVIFLSLLVAIAVIPAIEQARHSSAAQVAVHEKEIAGLQGALAQANAAKKASEPQVAEALVLTESTRFFDRLLGETYKVFDSTSSGVVFASTRTEARSAEIVIDCKASAVSYEAAQGFAHEAGKGPHKASGLSSMRPGGETTDSGGISFEYQKRVALH
jgi:hypothetical protein